MGKGSNTTTTQTSNTSRADPQADALYRSILDRAQNVASTPYQAYQGQLVAPVNAQQQAGIGNINANAGFATPYIQEAAGFARQSGQPINASAVQNYLNPYTQRVVDATQAQFDRSNATQQSALKGNAISSGALGGNRVGVAQANLAEGQAAQQNPVIAGLYSQGYQQALAAAQADAQRAGTAAYSLGNLGVAGQNAALTGAQSQIGAGTLQQQTEQAQNTADYGQFMQAQGYPYQQLQWLAGMGTGVGSQLGGTTTATGSSTPPPPNYTSQLLGLGTAALGFLSDENAKEDIEPVGRMNDGQIIYRYRYKGDPRWQIGLLAQEVIEGNPEAVHHTPAGLSVDYKTATDDAARAPGLAAGGEVAPWSEGKGWIPQAQIHGGSGAPGAAGAPGVAKDTGPDPEKIMKSAMGLAQGVKDFKWNFGNSPTNILPQVAGFAPSVNGSVSPAGFGGGFGILGGLYAAGGGVDMPIYDQDEINPMDAAAMNKPLTFADRIAPAQEAVTEGAFDPQGANYTDMKLGEGVWGDPMETSDVRMPTPRPPEAGSGEQRPVVAAGDDDTPTDVSASARPNGVVPYQAGFANPYLQQAAAQPEEERVGLFLKMSPAVQAGLLATGLGLMASRSPNLGNAIGDAGIAGFGAYGAVKEAEAKKAKTAADLSRDAAKYANELKLKVDQQTETGRHNRATEENARANRSPSQWTENPDGTVTPRRGGQFDPEAIAAREKARAGAKADPSLEMDDETIQLLADRVRAGDTRALQNIGRGQQTSANIARIHARVARDAAAGKPVSDTARSILANAAQSAGHRAASQRQATILANLSVYGKTAFRATDLALQASNEIPRTQFQPVNKILNAYRTKTGDPKIVALGAAVNSLINEYARAISGGRPTVNDKHHAEEMLNTAQTKEQFEAVIDMMRQELISEEKALPAAKGYVDSIYNPTSKDGQHSISESVTVPSKSFPAAGGKAAIPPPDKREIGKVYTNAQGAKARWTGTGWERVP